MSSIVSISQHNTADFELRPDATRPGGMALVDISGKNGYTTSDAASISEAGRILARQLATARDEMAAQKDAASRYGEALAFGKNFENFIINNTNIEKPDNFYSHSRELNSISEKTSTTYSTVSAQGTVVSVAYLPVEESRQDTKAQLYTAQITRKDGLQLNIALEDDIRVNDLEGGGLSIYYAASGITRTFDAQGNESISQDEAGALGSAGNDIIINRFSSKVDAGDGDDVIFNLADNAELLGGAGNDKILLTRANTSGLTIDGGAGDDIIVGVDLSKSIIRMEDGSDSLIASSIYGANISASGNNFIKTGQAHDITLTSRNGALNADIKRIYKGNLDIERIGDNFSVDGFQNVNAVFGDGDMTLTTGGIGDSNFAFGKGDLTLNARAISYSTITHTEGSSTINTSGGLGNSHIILGNEQGVDQDGKQINNIINSGGIYRSVIDSKGGNLNIITGGNDGSIINANNGDAHITLDSSHFTTINTGSGNDTIIARSLHGVSLSTGSGNDTIIADTLFETNINAGDGDDVIRVNKAAHYSYVNASNGNNTVNVGDLNSTSISAGNGNNTIHIGQNYGNSSLNMGSGNNTYVTDAAKQLAAQKPAPLEAKNSVDTDALLMDALFGTEGKNARNAAASTTPDFKRRMLQKAAAAYAGRL